MSFPEDFWMPIFMIVLFVVGCVVYSIATINRGSFADTPDWSKVVRRIVELICVFIALLLICFIGWNTNIVLDITMILFAVIGIIIVPVVIYIAQKKGILLKAEKLSEHLINAIILALFLLSGMLVTLITLAKGTSQIAFYFYLLILLDFILSAEFAFLFFQLYYMVVLKNVPSEEIVQIIRICKELDE